MKRFQNTHGDMFVIQRGEELHDKLNAYAKEHGLAGAWLSGLGGSGTLTLGFYDIETKEYEWHDYDTPLEILNLTGNLAWIDDEPMWHVHGSFGERDMNSIGGHVKSLIVGLTCELLVTPLEIKVTRAYDETTGLKLLSSE